MRELWPMWKRAFGLVWEQIIPLIGLNVMWLAGTLLVVTAGPATLAAYWWTARTLRDEQEPRHAYTFLKGFGRYFWRGLGWSAALALFLFLAYANITVWPGLLPPAAAAVVIVLWYYLLIFAAAMQPYLLEFLTVGDLPLWQAVKRSAWQVAASPVYSHINVAIPVIVIAAGLRYRTLTPLVLVAVVVAFLAVAAADAPCKYGERRGLNGRIEDVL